MSVFSLEIVRGLFIFLIVLGICFFLIIYLRNKASSYKILTSASQGLALRCVLPLEFSFYREKSTRTSLLEWLGVKKEFTLGFGFKRFDEKVYISSDTPRIVQVLKNREDLRHIIEEVLGEERRVRYIDFSDNALVIKIKGSKTTFNDNLKYIKERYTEKISQLASGFTEALKATPQSPYDRADRLNSQKVKTLHAWYVSALIAACAQLFYTVILNKSDYIPTNGYNAKQISMVAMGLFFIFFIASVAWGGGTRRTHRIVFYNFVWGSFLAALLSFNTYNALNVLLDSSPMVVYQVDYTTYSRRGSKSTSYYIRIENAKVIEGEAKSLPLYGDLHKGQTISISGSGFRRYQTTGQTQLTLRSGFFNQPYIEHI